MCMYFPVLAEQLAWIGMTAINACWKYRHILVPSALVISVILILARCCRCIGWCCCCCSKRSEEVPSASSATSSGRRKDNKPERKPSQKARAGAPRRSAVHRAGAPSA
uniref:Uncharacterized protein n=2 Tax=Lotharella globosa TaxID=91324 RepID=A0A7S4DRB2_9EUKA